MLLAARLDPCAGVAAAFSRVAAASFHFTWLHLGHADVGNRLLISVVRCLQPPHSNHRFLPGTFLIDVALLAALLQRTLRRVLALHAVERP